MNYQESLEYIESLAGIGIVPGLDNITGLCERLHNPQDRLRFVHIAGTNGKGSLLAYISTILKTAGYKVGRYLSPVISKYTEKIQINGKSITQAEMASMLTQVKEAADDMVAAGLNHPSAFEVETAAAFLYFEQKECDIVVLECGMGGKEDATNLITTTLVSVFTGISMDHMQFLGNTLQKIAENKAGIMKPGAKVVSAGQEAEVAEILLKRAAQMQEEVIFAGKPEKVKYGMEKQTFTYTDQKGKKYRDLTIKLAGTYQIENATLAVEAVTALRECGYDISEKDLRKGLADTVWEGRFEVLSKKPYFVIDGAHNEDAAKKLAQSVRFYFSNKRIIYIMGMLRDKEYEKVVAETVKYADQIITVTSPGNKRALPAMDLANTVRDYHPHVTTADSLEEAVEMAYLLAGREDVILCFGSLSYLGRMRKILKQREEKRKNPKRR